MDQEFVFLTRIPSWFWYRKSVDCTLRSTRLGHLEPWTAPGNAGPGFSGRRTAPSISSPGTRWDVNSSPQWDLAIFLENNHQHHHHNNKTSPLKTTCWETESSGSWWQIRGRGSWYIYPSYRTRRYSKSRVLNLGTLGQWGYRQSSENLRPFCVHSWWGRLCVYILVNGEIKFFSIWGWKYSGSTNLYTFMYNLCALMDLFRFLWVTRIFIYLFIYLIF